MNEEKLVELAKSAYDAYGEITEHKNYQGLPMPLWEDLTDKIRAAWCNAVKRVTWDLNVRLENGERMFP